MLSPACRVVTRPIMMNRSPSEHGLNPAAHARGRLRHTLPQRLDHLEYQRRVDRGDGQVAQCRKHEPDQRPFPVAPVLRVSPFLFVVANEALGALFECLCASSCDDGGAALRMLVGDRIDAIEPELARRARTLTSFRQREQANWTEAHVAVVAVSGVSINPLFRAPFGDAKVEAAASAYMPGCFARSTLRFDNRWSARIISTASLPYELPIVGRSTLTGVGRRVKTGAARDVQISPTYSRCWQTWPDGHAIGGRG